jgi:hypothetical protein
MLLKDIEMLSIVSSQRASYAPAPSAARRSARLNRNYLSLGSAG